MGGLRLGSTSSLCDLVEGATWWGGGSPCWRGQNLYLQQTHSCNKCRPGAQGAGDPVASYRSTSQPSCWEDSCNRCTLRDAFKPQQVPPPLSRVLHHRHKLKCVSGSGTSEMQGKDDVGGCEPWESSACHLRRWLDHQWGDSTRCLWTAAGLTLLLGT